MGILWPDQWTISTIDGGRSAQFEHTVSVFMQRSFILCLSPQSLIGPYHKRWRRCFDKVVLDNDACNKRKIAIGRNVCD